MFKKAFALALLVSFSAQAYAAADLSCRSTVLDSKRKPTLLSVEKRDDSAADVSNPLALRIDDKSNAIGFMADQVREVRTRNHRVITADNGFMKARIVVSSSGKADVTVEDGNGGVMILRKVIRCTRF